MTIVDRAYEIAIQHYGRAPRDRLAHPFGLADGDPCRWRISPDVWRQLVLELRHPELSVPTQSPDGDRLFGLSIHVDRDAPAETLRLERL